MIGQEKIKKNESGSEMKDTGNYMCFGGIIEHVHNQMADFTIGHCSNLTRSAWANQNAEKSERYSMPID